VYDFKEMGDLEGLLLAPTPTTDDTEAPGMHEWERIKVV
jgi:hypothetical protein